MELDMGEWVQSYQIGFLGRVGWLFLNNCVVKHQYTKMGSKKVWFIFSFSLPVFSLSHSFFPSSHKCLFSNLYPSSASLQCTISVRIQISRFSPCLWAVNDSPELMICWSGAVNGTWVSWAVGFASVIPGRACRMGLCWCTINQEEMIGCGFPALTCAHLPPFSFLPSPFSPPSVS